MYGTAVNQLVTVAVFLVLQSIQLAGYRITVNSRLNIRLSFVRFQGSGTRRGRSRSVFGSYLAVFKAV